MAHKKKKKEAGFDLNGIIFGFMKDFLFNTIREKIFDFIKEVKDSINKALIDLSKTLGKVIVSGVLFFLGLVFLLFSLIFLTKEYFQLSTGWTLLVWSFILLIIGLIYSSLAFKAKEEN